jgi:hypothetical protein
MTEILHNSAGRSYCGALFSKAPKRKNQTVRQSRAIFDAWRPASRAGDKKPRSDILGFGRRPRQLDAAMSAFRDEAEDICSH